LRAWAPRARRIRVGLLTHVASLTHVGLLTRVGLLTHVASLTHVELLTRVGLLTHVASLTHVGLLTRARHGVWAGTPIA
jgi:hypothetical protein